MFAHRPLGPTTSTTKGAIVIARTKKFTKSAAVALVMAFALLPLTAAPSTAATTGFRDVLGSYQFYKEISWMTDKGITTGYDGAWFHPERQVTREAFAAFLYRLDGSPSVSVPSKSPFRDVKTSDRFYKQIVWLEKTGITTGWPDGTFKPDWSISRSAMAAFLYRYDRFDGGSTYTAPKTSQFKDMKTSSKFFKEVSWLRDSGMTTGFSDGTFRPYAGTSRAATSAFLFRGYGSSSYSAPKYVAPKVPWKPSEITSVASSQVGYRPPGGNDNKFNDWIGGSSAWCAVYVAWVFEKAGYPGYVPKEKYYSSRYTSSSSTYVDKLKAAGVLDWNVSLGDLQKGDVVLIDWNDGKGASHSAIVDRVSGNGAWFYEGNTSNGTDLSSRGVYHRWRPLSYLAAVYDPRDYYDATH